MTRRFSRYYELASGIIGAGRLSYAVHAICGVIVDHDSKDVHPLQQVSRDRHYVERRSTDSRVKKAREGRRARESTRFHVTPSPSSSVCRVTRLAPKLFPPSLPLHSVAPPSHVQKNHIDIDQNIFTSVVRSFLLSFSSSFDFHVSTPRSCSFYPVPPSFPAPTLSPFPSLFFDAQPSNLRLRAPFLSFIDRKEPVKPKTIA